MEKEICIRNREHGENRDNVSEKSVKKGKVYL
jgi:hypothetical protein